MIMINLLNYFLETIVASGIFYMFFIVIFERKNFFRFNRFYIISTAFLSVIFPLIKINLPGYFMPVSGLNSGIMKLSEVVINGKNNTLSTAAGISWQEWILVLYLAGMILTAVFFFFKLYNLLRFIRSSRIESSGPYKILSGDGEIPSFSFFHFIFIGSRSLEKQDLEKIKDHEKAHVDQKHSWDSIYFEILGILFWFNPFIWLYRKRIIDVHEYLADEAVIRRNGEEGYSQLIIRHILGYSTLQPASQFKNSSTLKRIKKMKAYNKKSGKLTLALFLPAVLLVFFIISCKDSSQSLKAPGQIESGQLASGQNEQPVTVPFDTTANKVFTQADKYPTPEGSMTDYYRFIAENLKYPDQAKQDGKEGKVFIQFIVDKDGNFRNVKVLKGFDPECDQEAVRVISMSKAWKPGMKDGKPVAVQMVMPIFFKLGDKVK